MSTSPRKLSSAKSLDARLNPTIPAWGTASWLTSLTLLQIISDELLKEKHQNQTEAAFIKGMTKEDLLRSFEQTIPLLKNALTEGLDKLQGQADVDATLLNDKFSASKGSFTFTYGGKFILICIANAHTQHTICNAHKARNLFTHSTTPPLHRLTGQITDALFYACLIAHCCYNCTCTRAPSPHHTLGMDLYHAGLEGLIGLPASDVQRKMEWEHTESWYATTNFNCWYVDGGTTAKKEFEYVQGTAKELDCKNGRRDSGRGGWSLEEIMEFNSGLINKAGLQLVEVMALRLYTGPMYIW